MVSTDIMEIGAVLVPSRFRILIKMRRLRTAALNCGEGRFSIKARAHPRECVSSRARARSGFALDKRYRHCVGQESSSWRQDVAAGIGRHQTESDEFFDLVRPILQPLTRNSAVRPKRQGN